LSWEGLVLGMATGVFITGWHDEHGKYAQDFSERIVKFIQKYEAWEDRHSLRES
jgi:hypothetical protein